MGIALRSSSPYRPTTSFPTSNLMLKLGTLIYIRHNQQTLMLHRIKKQNDMHAGKWNGLGGKLELGETPEACAIREAYEESGLHMIDPVLRGMITFPGFKGEDDWYTFLFTCDRFTGELIDSNEGVLAWIDNDKLFDLNLWEGDKIFLRWLNQPAFFSGWLKYVDGKLVDHRVIFYQDGKVAELQSGKAADEELEIPTPSPEPKTGSQFAIYTPADDTYCWMCNGPVVKRHCKIICEACGFTRDCSDP
ncbi:MAG: 8-oxo-dGTP diphosphatase [Caldilineaceae bacterium]